MHQARLMSEKNIAYELLRSRLHDIQQMKARLRSINRALENALRAQVSLQEMLEEQEELGYELVAAMGADIPTQGNEEPISFSVMLEACVSKLMN